MVRIESELKKYIKEEWLESLEGVIGVAEGTYQPNCSCDPMRHKPRIEQFLINNKTYTPREIQSAFQNEEEVALYLEKMTLDRMCNIFTALGKAAKEERPLYTKDRREFWSDKQFTAEYQGNVRDALLAFADYMVAMREDNILLNEKNDWDNCADKYYLEWVKSHKKTIEELNNISEEGIQRIEKKASKSEIDNKNLGMLKKGYPFSFGKELACELRADTTIKQYIIDDDPCVAERIMKEGTLYVGVLVHMGITQAIDHLIEFYTHKSTQPDENHFH